MLWLNYRNYCETFQTDKLLVLDRFSGTTEIFYRHDLLDKYSFFNYNTFFLFPEITTFSLILYWLIIFGIMKYIFA